jgi:hypothetical protein
VKILPQHFRGQEPPVMLQAERNLLPRHTALENDARRMEQYQAGPQYASLLRTWQASEASKCFRGRKQYSIQLRRSHARIRRRTNTGGSHHPDALVP